MNTTIVTQPKSSPIHFTCSLKAKRSSFGAGDVVTTEKPIRRWKSFARCFPVVIRVLGLRHMACVTWLHRFARLEGRAKWLMTVPTNCQGSGAKTRRNGTLPPTHVEVQKGQLSNRKVVFLHFHVSWSTL